LEVRQACSDWRPKFSSHSIILSHPCSLVSSSSSSSSSHSRHPPASSLSSYPRYPCHPRILVLSSSRILGFSDSQILSVLSHSRILVLSPSGSSPRSLSHCRPLALWSSLAFASLESKEWRGSTQEDLACILGHWRTSRNVDEIAELKPSQPDSQLEPPQLEQKESPTASIPRRDRAATSPPDVAILVEHLENFFIMAHKTSVGLDFGPPIASKICLGYKGLFDEDTTSSADNHKSGQEGGNSADQRNAATGGKEKPKQKDPDPQENKKKIRMSARKRKTRLAMTRISITSLNRTMMTLIQNIEPS
jgi:hypothetical protein